MSICTNLCTAAFWWWTCETLHYISHLLELFFPPKAPIYLLVNNIGICVTENISCIHWCVPTLVCVDGLQVHDVTDDVVLICDAVPSQHVSGLSCDVQSFSTAIPLQHGYHLWSRSIMMRTGTLKENCLFSRQESESN